MFVVPMHHLTISVTHHGPQQQCITARIFLELQAAF
jgi:hypothetical protein